MSNKNDSRYPASSHMTIQRPYGQERRRTPSPVPPPPATYASYDRYVPPRGNTFYREPLQNSYRPDTWHTERQYSGPPSPDRYRMPRSTDGDSWGRQPWRPIEQLSWTERRNASDPYDSSWGRPRRDIMAQPMFEPSDNWKQFHGDGPEAQESDGREWSYDRYPPEPPRDLRNRSPERQSLREHYPPAFVPNDRFRRLSGPSEQREAHPYGPRSDSYRPQYEERGSWGVSSYHPGNIEPRIREQRPPVRASRFIPRQEPIGERLWIPREASVSGESVQNSPVSSPIRTRTNLPDRLPLSHSRSGSGSYLHSPVNKPSPRPSWDLQSPTLPKRSLSSPQSLPEARYPSETLPYVPDHDEENVPLANEHSTHPSSHPPSPKLTPLASRSLLSPRIDQQGFVQHPSVAFDHHPSSPGPRSAQSLRVNDHKDQKPLPSPSESLLGSHPASIPSSPHQSHQGCTENDPSRPQPVFDNHGSIVSNNRDEEAFMDVDEEPMSPQLAPVMLIDSRDESSPEPDIPLAALTRHATTSRASVSEPSTPMLNLSEPPSRDEPTLRPQHWLAPNIQPTNEPTPLHKILRAVVMVRLQRDRQTSEERVNPVLLDNLSKVEPPSMPHVTTPEDIVREITAGVRQKALQESYVNARESLQARFARRQTDLSVKVANLREEYMGLHLQWAVHCGKLDEVAKALALQEAAATAGRTTRRSLATMGDAVRSDLEMEQIIASLGNEEMTDANHLGAKNAAVIPDMISVTEGEVDHLYDDTNNEVENPAKYYAPQTGIADWTEEEVNIFLDKFGEFPKQFGIIADFLPHKSPSQCVTFYYLHKNKHINFKEVVARRVTKRKRGGRKQKSNALLADIRKRDDEVSASGPGRRRRAPAPSLPNLETRKGSGRRVAVVAQADQTPNGTPTPEPDAEPRKRKRRIIARAVATEQEDGTEELDVDPRPKRVRKPRKPAVSTPTGSITPLETPILPDLPDADPMEDVVSSSKFAAQAGPSMQRKPSGLNGTWSEEDKGLFLHLLAQYGDDFKRIASSMPNKTTVQVGAFYRANADDMGLQRIAINAPKRSPTPEARQGIWKQATFTGPSVSFQRMSMPTENSQLSTNRLNLDSQFVKNDMLSSSQALARSISGSSTPTSGGIIGSFPYHPSSYETVQIPYGYHHLQSVGNGDLSHVNVPSIQTHHIGHIANPSPFATGPLTTRFSSFPYRNFSPSHFTDNPSPSFSAMSTQSSYAQSARAHESEPLISKTSMSSMSDSRMTFDYR